MALRAPGVVDGWLAARLAPNERPLERSSTGALVLGVWGLIFVVAFLVVFATGLPDTSKLYDVQRQPSITYLDRSGALIAVRGSQYAPPVDIDPLPPYVPAAFVAIEDRHFYHHLGFDPIGMAAGRSCATCAPATWLQGGSTITQQLAAQPVPDPRPEPPAQGAGADAGGVAGDASSPRSRSWPSTSTGSISAAAPTASRRPPQRYFDKPARGS